jgi:cytochrome c oxidase subunit II
MIMTLTTTLAQQSLKKYFFSSIGASSQAAETEDLFMYILWINIISFIALMFLLGWFIMKYRRSKQTENYQVSAAHNTPLELAWSIIPLLLMIPIFYYGFTGYADKIAAPADSEEIKITGQKWFWTVTYKNGANPQSPQVELTKTQHPVVDFIVPEKRPVKFIMSSTDVIHAFYVPDFRTKMDVIPNRYTSMWFYPQKATDMTPDPITGKPKNPPHKVFCAEYCGQDHSEMAGQMRIVPVKEYEATLREWLDYNKGLNLLKVGELVYKTKNCFSCHSIDGSKSTGPTWKNMFGDKHEYTNGETTPAQGVDENWLRENILYSQKRILKGFDSSMPVFAGQLNPLELDGVILYIKSLTDAHKAEAEAAGKETVQEYRDREKAAPPKK